MSQNINCKRKINTKAKKLDLVLSFETTIKLACETVFFMPKNSCLYNIDIRAVEWQRRTHLSKFSTNQETSSDVTPRPSQIQSHIHLYYASMLPAITNEEPFRYRTPPWSSIKKNLLKLKNKMHLTFSYDQTTRTANTDLFPFIIKSLRTNDSNLWIEKC